MKKLMSIVLCTVILMLPLCSVGSFAAGESFVVLGDSIAEGMGSTDVNKDSYAAVVAAANGYELHNISRGGATSFTLKDKVFGDNDARELIRTADIIDISIGGNDFLLNNLVITVLTAIFGNFSRADAALAAFQENFTAIITEVRSLNPTALVIVQTLYNPLEILSIIGGTFETVLGEFNAFFFDYLDENPDAYVISDVHGAFAGKPDLIAHDIIHPSVKGHALIAQTVLATIADFEAGIRVTPRPDPSDLPSIPFTQRISRLIAFIRTA